MSYPTVAPEKFEIGTTVSWIHDPGPDYRSSDGWALTYYFTRDTDHRTASGVAQADGTFLVTISATNSALFTAGHYSYIAHATKASEVYPTDRGQLEVTPSFSANYDARSSVKKRLDSIRAVLEERADQASIAQYTTISGLSLAHVSHDELAREMFRLERMYAQEVQAERVAKGLPTGRRLKAWFR